MRALPIYLTTALMFGAVSARGLGIPLYAHQLGASRSSVGLLFTVYMLVAAAVGIPSGVIADRLGRRNTVLFSIAIAALSQVAAAFSNSVEWLFVWQLVGGISAGASQTALYAALADAVEPGRLGAAMGWMTLSLQTGFFTGPAVAGILLHWFTLQQDLVITSVPLALAFGMATRSIPGGRRAGSSLAMLGPLRKFASGSTFWALTASLLALAILWGTFQAYLPLLGKEVFGLTGTSIGYMLGIMSVFNGATRVPAGKLVDRLQSRAPLVTVCIVGFAATVAVLPHLTGFWLPTALISLTVPFIAVSFVATAVVYSHIADDDSRGIAMGVYSAVLFLGLGLGPALFGPVIQARGYGVGFLACAIGATALAATALLIRHQPIRRWRASAERPIVGDYAD